MLLHQAKKQGPRGYVSLLFEYHTCNNIRFVLSLRQIVFKEELYMKLRIITFIIILCVLFLALTLMLGSLFSRAGDTVLTAKESKSWTSLFDRRGESGWLGADGIYSVALDGNDSFGSASRGTDTFFIFSDTLMGNSDRQGDVTELAPMPAQTSALLSGADPSDRNVSFVYGNGGNGNLGEHLFGAHFWMLDCYVQNDMLYILGFPEESWKPERIDMVSIPIRDGAPVYAEYAVTENITQLWHNVSDEYLYAFGIGITANTVASAATDPDGYIYVYGYRDAINEMSRKDLIVGRIHESDFPDFSKFKYWNGENWCDNIEDSAILLNDVSCEMSVSYVPCGSFVGKYIAVYTQYTRSGNIMYAIGDTPYGPFDTPVKCYDAKEHGETGASGVGSRVVYNAKAHPHLSSGDKLLISYNVNVEGEGAEQWTTDYHLRFIELDLDPDHLTVVGMRVSVRLLTILTIIATLSVMCTFLYLLRKTWSMNR